MVKKRLINDAKRLMNTLKEIYGSNMEIDLLQK